MARSFLLLATVTFRPLRELLPSRSIVLRGLLVRRTLLLRGFRCRLLSFLGDELRQLCLDILVVALLACQWKFSSSAGRKMTYQIGPDESGGHLGVDSVLALRWWVFKLLNLLNILPYTSQFSEYGMCLGVHSIKA